MEALANLMEPHLLGRTEPMGLLLRVTILLGAAALLAWALRHGAAATRHRLWTTTFVLLLGLPLAVLLLPAWELPLMPASRASAVGSTPTPAAAPQASFASTLEIPAEFVMDSTAAQGGVSESSAHRGVAAHPALAIWGAGSVLALLSLLIGALRFAARVRGARAIDDPDWLAAAAELEARLDIRRPVWLLASAAIDTPMTGGWLRPVILLPQSAGSWSAERRAVVLTHELIHVRQRDALRQILGGVALALYWFHPLSWVAARLSVVSREQACDEGVLGLGARPSDYARHLFDLAAGGAPVKAALALPLVQRSSLEKRVMAILRPRRARPNPWTASLVSLTVVMLGVAAAMAMPVPRASIGLTSDLAAVASLAAPGPQLVGAEAAPSAAASPAAPVVAEARRSAADSAAATASSAATSPAVAPRAATCRMEGSSGTFVGTLGGDGDRVETSGWHNGDRVIQRYFDDLRLCMRLHGDVVMSEDRQSFRALGSDSWAVLESEAGALRRLVVTEGSGGLEYGWNVDGRTRPFDAEARAWEGRMLHLLDLYWQASSLRGQQSSLRGRISSYRGHVSSLRGQVSSHRGHVSSLRGEASSYRGHVSSLNGRISSYNGHVSSLRGQISSHHGRISSLRAAMNATDSVETRAGLEREIAEHEARIHDIEAEIEAYGLEAKVAAVQREIGQYDVDAKTTDIDRRIEDYDLEGKVSDIEQQIEDYDLDSKVRAVEKEIEALDADGRATELERRAEPELNALRELIRRS
jgi:beta-lactamase regulating signal transducer with metallopeptidase domain/predicted  nucleic acid-binding Zn-ribbon protein